MNPHHLHARGPLYRLQGLDVSLLGATPLYLAGASTVSVGGLPLQLLADEWVGSGTFRNSFYAEPWVQLSGVRDLWLVVEAQGSLRVRVMRAVKGRPAEVVSECTLEQAERRKHAQFVALASDLLAGSRLFWHIDALDGAVLHDAVWCTRSPPREIGPLAVLIRTYRRGADVRALLQRFADAAAGSVPLADALSRCEFWVLDTTEGAGEDWAGMRELGLRLRLMTGPNLGGGGNASHLLHHFLAAQAQAPEPSEELLILDDDLSISAETVARYRSFCAYRRVDVICSLPVLMKSRPTQIWEDGGFWGRAGFESLGDGVSERGLAPHLVRHGLVLDGYAHLDEFGPLNRCEYATFIFYGLPLRVLDKIGLPAAFFLRGDDVELSMRAGAAGIPVVTNPNLAAWHEPAHSHAQEYMAVLHGVILNLSWTTDSAEAFAAWFEQRLIEHALLGDALGASVYRQVLIDLLDPDAKLLTLQFDSHYPARLQQWQRHGETRAESAQGWERLLQEPQTRVLPFLYPGLQRPALAATERVLLRDAAQTGWRELPRSKALERLALIESGAALLRRFEADFDTLRLRWRERLALSGQPEFWSAVAQRHRHDTRLQFQTSWAIAAAADPPSADPPLPPSAPLRELRERLVRELALAASLRREALAPHERPGAAVVGARTRWWSSWRRRATPVASSATAPTLPPDFDPHVYLSLNHDVARSGVDPTRHYLDYGRLEGRRYRP